jgi:hypothetical protein
VIELTTDDELREAADDDSLLMWAARGFTTGARAWAHGAATAVASPALSGRDRVAVRGPLADAAPLLRLLLREMGPSYRPLGDAALIAGLAEELDEIEFLGTFGWMTISGDGLGPSDAQWLGADDLDEVAALIDQHFPTSFAHPGRPGAAAWAGVRDSAGRLTAIAADAWSAPTIGLLAGVATHPDHGRGRGHAEAACRLVLDSHLRRSGRAGLMVEDWNAPALRLYRRLGLDWRALAASHQV